MALETEYDLIVLLREGRAEEVVEDLFADQMLGRTGLDLTGETRTTRLTEPLALQIADRRAERAADPSIDYDWSLGVDGDTWEELKALDPRAEWPRRVWTFSLQLAEALEALHWHEGRGGRWFYFAGKGSVEAVWAGADPELRDDLGAFARRLVRLDFHQGKIPRQTLNLSRTKVGPDALRAEPKPEDLAFTLQNSRQVTPEGSVQRPAGSGRKSHVGAETVEGLFFAGAEPAVLNCAGAIVLPLARRLVPCGSASPDPTAEERFDFFHPHFSKMRHAVLELLRCAAPPGRPPAALALAGAAADPTLRDYLLDGGALWLDFKPVPGHASRRRSTAVLSLPRTPADGFAKMRAALLGLGVDPAAPRPFSEISWSGALSDALRSDVAHALGVAPAEFSIELSDDADRVAIDAERRRDWWRPTGRVSRGKGGAPGGWFDRLVDLEARLREAPHPPSCAEQFRKLVLARAAGDRGRGDDNDLAARLFADRVIRQPWGGVWPDPQDPWLLALLEIADAAAERRRAAPPDCAAHVDPNDDPIRVDVSLDRWRSEPDKQSELLTWALQLPLGTDFDFHTARLDDPRAALDAGFRLDRPSGASAG